MPLLLGFTRAPGRGLKTGYRQASDKERVVRLGSKENQIDAVERLQGVVMEAGWNRPSFSATQLTCLSLLRPNPRAFTHGILRSVAAFSAHYRL